MSWLIGWVFRPSYKIRLSNIYEFKGFSNSQVSFQDSISGIKSVSLDIHRCIKEIPEV